MSNLADVEICRLQEEIKCVRADNEALRASNRELTSSLAQYRSIERRDAARYFAGGRKQALMEFANYLEQQKPSAIQLGISPEYNAAVLQALKWASAQAREIAEKSAPLSQGLAAGSV